MLRCAVEDEPGRLAALAGAIGTAGGDIQAVTVVETDGRTAVDDLHVVVPDDGLGRVLDSVQAVEGLRMLYAGPSRGHPGDAVSRLAVIVESLLSGAMAPDEGVRALVGGLLHASSIELLHHRDAAPVRDPRVLRIEYDDRVLVARREYPFTDSERQRGLDLVRLCQHAAVAAA